MTRSASLVYTSPFNVNCCFVSLSILQQLFIHCLHGMIKITFCSLSSWSTLISLILVSFWFILPYSALFCCHSTSFRYIPVPFLFIPSHSGVIRFYSRVIPPCSGIFWFIPVYSALFLFIPVYSVPFRSIPVFSNAPYRSEG